MAEINYDKWLQNVKNLLPITWNDDIIECDPDIFKKSNWIPAEEFVEHYLQHLNKKLLILKDTPRIAIYSQPAFDKIKNLILNDKIGIIQNFKNYESPYNTEPLDIKNHETYWRTYSDCEELKISYNDGNSFICHIKIHNGRISDGLPYNLRWTADIIMPLKYLVVFYYIIDYRLTAHATNIYEKEQEKIRSIKIQELKNTIISKN